MIEYTSKIFKNHKEMSFQGAKGIIFSMFHNIKHYLQYEKVQKNSW